MAHALWSDRPLGVKLGALVAAGTLSLGAFAVITVQALNGTGGTTDQILATGQVTSRPWKRT
jgi:methyl-accepting chemotaxis protein